MGIDADSAHLAAVYGRLTTWGDEVAQGERGHSFHFHFIPIAEGGARFVVVDELGEDQKKWQYKRETLTQVRYSYKAKT